MKIDAKKIIREPMLHFVLIGAGIFVLFGALNPEEETPPNRILVTQEQIERFESAFARTWSRAPTPEERDLLISEHIRDEVFYREALNLGLDQGDSVIRRRLRQKMEFILEDVSAANQPLDEELQAFLDENPDKFQLEPKVAFQHVYLSPDKHSDIETDAAEILAQLNAGEDASLLGDVLMLPANYVLEPVSIFDRAFGNGFSNGLLSAPQGTWSGPIRSGFGWHLVLVREKVPGRLPELEEVREKVTQEWRHMRKVALEEETYQTLLSGYDVVFEPSDKGSDQ